MTTPSRSLVLASASPRRLRLLREHGYDVEVIPAHIDETWPKNLTPAEAVIELARRKAAAVAPEHADRPVLGADTAVLIDDLSLGKPASRDAAADMIRKLAGKTHVVYSGVALIRGTSIHTGCDQSQVTFRLLTDSEIQRYLDNAAYADKAGAYGIQDEGKELVASYDGRLDTIIGLPMNIVDELWHQVGAAA